MLQERGELSEEGRELEEEGKGEPGKTALGATKTMLNPTYQFTKRNVSEEKMRMIMRMMTKMKQTKTLSLKR